MASIAKFTQALLDTNGILSAFVLAERRMQLLIAERTDLRDLVPFVGGGNVSGAGSDTLRDRRVGLGASLAMSTPTNEDDSVSASAVTVETGDVAVARHSLVIQSSFFSQIVDDTGMLNSTAIAETMVGSYIAHWRNRLAVVGAAITGSLGSNSAALDVDTWMDMIEEYEENSIDGQIRAMLHSKAVGQLRRSATNEGGSLQYAVEAQELAKAKQLGLVGSYLDVPIYMSNSVTEAGGGKQNVTWTDGCIKQAVGTTERITTVNAIGRPAGTPIILGIDETHQTATQLIVANAFFGLGVVYDARGRVIKTLA
jgi:hypothetical protein